MILTAAYGDVQVSVPDSAYSLAGFRRWAASDDFPEHGRFMLFDGEVFVDMPPERIGTHNQVKAEITFTLEGINREDKLGVLYPDGLWLTNDTAGSVRKDTVTLLNAYFRAGVLEYWLVDARGDEIQFTVFRRDDEEFIPVESQAGWLASGVFGRAFRLERSLDRVGAFDYTLHVRGK